MNWYPNLNPSEETKRTTGLFSLLSGRETSKSGGDGGNDDEWEASKKRKAKATAADRAIQVVRTREAKSTVLAVALGVVGDEESVLNESNAVVEISWPSSAIPAEFWARILPGGKRERDSVSMILTILR